MRIAVMQPTYLPWLGYLDLMDHVDQFVLLNDVPFSKQSWQQRNRIRASDGLQWLTVPVISKGRTGQLIRDVELVDEPWVRRHIRSIEHHYAHAPHADLIGSLSERLEHAARSGRLEPVTTATIEWLREQLGITTPVTSSTELALAPGRIERLVHACRMLGATTYVTPPGAAEYLLGNEDPFVEANIEVLVHDYEHPTYPQCQGGFVAYASALDLVLNRGPDSAGVVRSGRQAPLTLESWSSRDG